MGFQVLSPRFAAVCVLAALPFAVHADDLTLKDGSTIKGTIVGFDDNSFKVQTSYGFALVRKDQVVTIRVTGPGASDAPEQNPQPAAEKTSPEKPKTDPAIAAIPAATPKPTTAPVADAAKVSDKPGPPIVPAALAPAVPKSPGTPAASASVSPSKPGPPPAIAGAIPTPVAPTTNAPPPNAPAPIAAPAAPPPVLSAATRPAIAPTPPKATPTSAPAPPAVTATAATAAPTPAAPPRPPAPEPILETVSGNTYMNNTYRFQLYKPPSWQVLAAARTVLPGAIAALGTDDQQTYLLIGQEPAGKALYLAAEAADKRLRDVMDNFRPQGQEQVLVAGSWATAHRFRGSVDQHDWSGVVVLVPHGTRLFTIFGMTRADTDLVQIQENIIDRAIGSLQFNGP